jgi:hypothetical protein
MLGTHFYNEAVAKTIKGFGTLFNNITLETTDPQDGSLITRQKVPLAYGPKNKFTTRLEENPELRKVAITLPRIYFEMTGISYDSARKTSPTKKIFNSQGDQENRVDPALIKQYVPVPYNMEFELGILAKSQTDGLQILEQILPFFQPSFNININFIPEMEEVKDVHINLNNVDYEDDWDDDFLQRRLITWTLRFTAKSYIYGPYTKADVIRKALVYETAGGIETPRRAVKIVKEVEALKDYDGDGDIDTADRNLVSPEDVFGDDFGFSEGIFIGDEAQE